MCRERGHVAYLGSILNTLGDATRAQGDLEAAALAYGESLEISRRLGEQVGVAICIEGFASVAQRRGQMRRAARLYGAAAGIRERVGIPQRPAQRADHEGAVAATRRQLGEVAFVAAWAAGRRLTVDEAVDEATTGGAADRGGT